MRSVRRGHTARSSYAAVLALSAVIVVLWSGGTAARGSTTERQIRQVEHGLLPPVLLGGAPPEVSDLTTEMTRLHVPGVSVAVIHGGRIARARGFGVTRLGGPPVTPTGRADSQSSSTAAVASIAPS